MKNIQCPHFETVTFENIEKTLILKWVLDIKVTKKNIAPEIVKSWVIQGYLGDLPHKNEVSFVPNIS